MYDRLAVRRSGISRLSLLCESFRKTLWPHQDAKEALVPGLLPRLSDVPSISFPQLPDEVATAFESGHPDCVKMLEGKMQST